MKDKILKLIYKKLDEVDGSTKFYNCHKYEVIRPFELSIFDVEKNEDYQYNWLGFYRGDTQYWSPSGSYRKEDKLIKVNLLSVDRKYEDIELLSNTIVFEDGEPDIRISTMPERTENIQKAITKNFWGRNYSYKTTYTYKFIVHINCGHISFNLSEQESIDLLTATKTAYDRSLSLKSSYDDKVLDDKLNLRLDEVKKKKKKGKKDKSNE
jgi:hypothetical protein